MAQETGNDADRNRYMKRQELGDNNCRKYYQSDRRQTGDKNMQEQIWSKHGLAVTK